MYQERTKCIFCSSSDLTDVIDSHVSIPQGMFMCEDKQYDAMWMPYNILFCPSCKTFQNKYLADIEVLYSAQHVAPIGNIRRTMDIMFSEMVNANPFVNGIIEIGGGQGYLADLLVADNKIQGNYHIVDPMYKGSRENRIVIDAFVESVPIHTINANTIIMSHFLEHLYTPKETLQKILHNGIEHVFVCHPDFDDYTGVYPLTYNVLHCEHTFYIDNDFLVALIESYGYVKIQERKHMGYAIMYEFTRGEKCDHRMDPLCNLKTESGMQRYLIDVREKVQKINATLEACHESDTDVYIWPSSIHTLTLFYHGLNHKALKGVLDNSESKIGKFMYGYNTECISFNSVINSSQKVIVFLNGGCYNKDVENMPVSPSVTLVQL